MIKSLVIVGLGGMVGTMGRYLISIWMIRPADQLPLGTLTVNLLGSFIIGILIAISARHTETWRLLLITGFCGGFTTFSTFSLENLKLLQTGNFSLFAQYTLVSLVGGLLFVYLGYLLSTKIFH
jgi:CrcB protein